MFKKSFYAIAVILLSFSVIFSQQEETEPAPKSSLTNAKLPANAERVFPSSVPAEINQGLEKMIEAGEGKIVQGETEVLAWSGGSFKKSNVANLIKQIENNLKAEGWTYEAAGTEEEVTFFSVLKEKPTKRAILGYFVATDEALVVAWTEALPANSDENTNENVEENVPAPIKNSSNNSSGKISDFVGKWERKQSGVSSYSNGKYQGSSGNYESYTFFADGRVEYSSLIAVQNYGCRLEAFSSRKGRASLSGGNLTVNLTTGTLSRDDSFSKSKNYTKPMDSTSETYKWQIEKDEYGNTELALTESNSNTYYYRRTK